MRKKANHYVVVSRNFVQATFRVRLIPQKAPCNRWQNFLHIHLYSAVAKAFKDSMEATIIGVQSEFRENSRTGNMAASLSNDAHVFMSHSTGDNLGFWIGGIHTPTMDQRTKFKKMNLTDPVHGYWFNQEFGRNTRKTANDLLRSRDPKSIIQENRFRYLPLVRLKKHAPNMYAKTEHPGSTRAVKPFGLKPHRGIRRQLHLSIPILQQRVKEALDDVFKYNNEMGATK